jgi:hypothetical protein
VKTSRLLKSAARTMTLRPPFGLPQTRTEGKLLPPSAKWLPRPLTCPKRGSQPNRVLNAVCVGPSFRSPRRDCHSSHAALAQLRTSKGFLLFGKRAFVDRALGFYAVASFISAFHFQEVGRITGPGILKLTIVSNCASLHRSIRDRRFINSREQGLGDP